MSLHPSRTPLRGPAGRIDALCDRFESSWLAGGRPRLEDFLSEAGETDRAALLRELLALELDYRPRCGEPPTAEEYRRRLPNHASLVDEVFAAYPTAGKWVPEGMVPGQGAELGHPTQPYSGDRAQPAVLSGYDLLGEIARGAMGVVFKALQRKLNRVVALKMILTGADVGLDFRERFRAEAEAVARLQHPNIVQIHEISEHEGRLFFSMEYCSGGSLDKKLRGAPLPPLEAARLATTLARAVHAAHLQNVIHRDLKPGNVLLAADGTPKVSDFGLAKRLDADDDLSWAGQVLGTPSYMAPEQASGKSHKVGPAADVYALGAILYELLTGRPPFRGPTVHDTLGQVIADEPAPPRRLQPRTPRDVETICLKCLAKAPAKRYLTASALADDLDRFLAGRPILARPVGPLERLTKWARRKPAAAALIGSVVLLFLSVFGWALYAWREADAGRTAETKLAATEAGLRRQVEQQLYFHRIARADREWSEGKPAWAAEQLALCPEAFREWEWRSLHRRLDGEVMTVLEGHGGPISCVASSPDGSCVAAASGDGSVRLWNPATNTVERALAGHVGSVDWVAFSPDGESLASAGADGWVVVWDRRTGAPRMKRQAADGPLSCVAFRACGNELATSAFDGKDSNEVRVWRIENAELVLARTLHGHTLPITGMAYSSDGALLATASRDKTVRLWDAATGTERLVFRNHQSPVAAVAFHPNGQTLISAAGEIQPDQQTTSGEVLLWSARTGAVEHRLHEHTMRSVAVAFSPDGRLAATGAWDGKVVVWETTSGLQLLNLSGHSMGVTSVTFCGDGRYLASASQDQTVRLWDGGP